VSLLSPLHGGAVEANVVFVVFMSCFGATAMQAVSGCMRLPLEALRRSTAKGLVRQMLGI
jgi:hypothetical protein